MRNLDALLLVESGPPEKADYLAALKKLVPGSGRMRRAWTGAGLPQPRSYRCGTLDDARRAVDELDGCCVVKPCGMMGSRGVSRIRGGTAAEIEEAYRRAVQEDFEEEDLRYAFGVTRLVLVEEYVEADLEISVKL